LKGQVYNDNLSFWLLSGRMEVLSQHQVESRIECCRDRGENVMVVYSEVLPDGARWLNL
jgi:hypothetical protein